MSSHKYYRAVEQLATRYGYTAIVRGKHLALIAPDKPRITAAGSPKNEDNTLKSIEKDILKYGHHDKS